MLTARTNGNGLTLPHVFEELLREPFFAVAPTRLGGAERAGDQGTLALDVSETERELVIRATLPGFTRDQVSIEVADGVLRIAAEASEETDQGNERYHRRERRVGSLTRMVRLPVPVQEDKAQAQLKDGVLTLVLPKHEKVLPRKIAVN
ncbi:MAG: Hsp20/alpha crystallin family protein [Phycisphaerales bacterium]|nr:Hsp20/alpha crystallin family protein [Phycisphaerales bacterium]